MSGNELVPSLHVLWQNNLLKRKVAPIGLKNLGNTCYLNSVLQCLTYTPPLANFCLRSQHSSICNQLNSKSNANCPFCFLEKRIARSLTHEAACDAPLKIHNRLHHFAKHFRNGRQEDAHELLRYAIEACNSVCAQLQKQLAQNGRQSKQSDGKPQEEPHTVVKEIFGGVIQSQVKCKSCNAESNKLDDIMDLSLDLGRVNSVKEALSRFFQPEVLDGDNKYRCSKCQKLCAARKQMFVFRAPNVLVIQLKRFENIYGGKIDRHIAFEERLGLGGHMCSSSKDARPDYTLYGVVVHSGHTQDGGHYYAYVKDSKGSWFCCDDSNVYGVNVQAVLGEKSYMLFYVRTNSGPRIPREALVSFSNSTPSPPTTPDTDLSEPPKKHTVSNSNSAVPRLKISNANALVLPQIRFGSTKIGVVQYDKPVKVEKHISVQITEVCKKVTSLGNTTKELRSKFITENSISNQPETNRKAETVLPAYGTEGIQVLAVSGGEDCSVHKQAAVLSLNNKESIMDANHIGASSQLMKICDKSGHSVMITSHGRDSMRGDGDPCETKKSIYLKRTREEFCSFAENPAGDSASQPSQTARDIQLSKAEKAGSSIEKLKFQLEQHTREELQRYGWCDSLRESLRAAKRKHMSEESWGLESIDKDTLRRQLITQIQEPLKEQIPKVLKEHLVDQLRTFFMSKIF